VTVARFRTVLFSERNSPFGLGFLRYLSRSEMVDLIALVTRTDEVVCDYYVDDDYSVNLKDEALTIGIQVFQPPDVNASEGLLRPLNADYFIIANYQQILGRPIFELPRELTINFHPSPLPRYAGLRPFFWMARNRETRGGVAAIRVNEIIDGGDIIEEIPITLRGDEDEQEIRAIHFEKSLELLSAVVRRFGNFDRKTFRPQDLSQRSYFSHNDYLRATERPS
jgi:methionyl-tRNA formyltransferase